MKYVKKPVEIEAIQFKIENLKEILFFIGQIPSIEYYPEKTCDKSRFDDYLSDCINEGIKIKTLEGIMNLKVGDYLIKGVKGEFYPCREDIFYMTYEKA